MPAPAIPGPTALFLGSALVCAGLMFPVRVWLRRAGIIDRPNQRSSHTHPTIRGGGVAIVLAVFGGLLVAPSMTGSTKLGCTLAFVLVAGVSFLDDLKPLGVRVRMGVHVIAAVLLVLILAVTEGEGGGPGWVFTMIAIVWIVGYTNAFNFMDGINGLAAVQAIAGGLGTAIFGVMGGLDASHPAVSLSLAIAGAALGFLPFNFPRATVFMGDVGSATLGLATAFAAWWVARAVGWWLVLPLVALHANFLLDTALTMFRRWRRGDVIYQAHREHFYQLAVRSGLSHVAVTLSVAAGQWVVVVLLGLAVSSKETSYVALACAAVPILWAGFFTYWTARFRRTRNRT